MEKECKVCHCSFEPTKKTRTKCCGKECSAVWNHPKMVYYRKSTPHWKYTKIEDKFYLLDSFFSENGVDKCWWEINLQGHLGKKGISSFIIPKKDKGGKMI
jgi:hypothetical protein